MLSTQACPRPQIVRIACLNFSFSAAFLVDFLPLELLVYSLIKCIPVGGARVHSLPWHFRKEHDIQEKTK